MRVSHSKNALDPIEPSSDRDIIKELYDSTIEKAKALIKERITPAVLFAAALDGDERTISHAIEQSIDIAVIDGNKRSAIVLAAMKGHSKVVNSLAQAGARIDLKHFDDIACSNTSVLLVLLDRNLIDQSKRLDLFILSLERSDFVVARALMSKGMAVPVLKRVVDGGDTILPRFVATGSIEVVRVLLDLGFCPSDDHWSTINHFNRFNYASALAIALEKGHIEVAKLLKDKGGPLPSIISAVKERSETLLVSLLKFGPDWRLSEPDDQHALYYGALGNSYKLVEILLESGADPCGCLDYRPLIAAADKQWPYSLSPQMHYGTDVANYRILKKLLQCGADPNIADSNGYTALRYATCRQATNVVRCLLQYGAQPREDGAYRPLLETVRRGDHTTTALILDWGADAHDATNVREQAFSFAVSKGTNRAAVASALISRDMSLLRYLYHETVRWLSYSIVTELLEAHRISPDTCDPWGRSLLEDAVRHKHARTVEVLISHGADVNIKAGATSLLALSRELGDKKIEYALWISEALEDADVRRIQQNCVTQCATDFLDA